MLEIGPDIAQSTHGIRNIFADIRNVPTRPHMVLGMFLLAFSVSAGRSARCHPGRGDARSPSLRPVLGRAGLHRTVHRDQRKEDRLSSRAEGLGHRQRPNELLVGRAHLPQKKRFLKTTTRKPSKAQYAVFLQDDRVSTEVRAIILGEETLGRPHCDPSRTASYCT